MNPLRVYERLVGRLGRPAATTLWLLGWLVLLLAVSCAVGAAVVAVAGGDETPLDIAVLQSFQRGRTPARSSWWSVVTHAGGSAFVVPFTLAVAFLWWLRRRDDLPLYLLGSAYLGGTVLYNAAKRIVGRQRPAADLAFHPETGLAFPSGHATNAAALYTALALLLLTVVARRAWRALVVVAAATLVVLVSISRLYLAAHWVTDVVAGAVLGTVWAVVVWSTLTSRAGPYPRRT